MLKYALIVAGGSGTRMKTDLPKQFLLLAGKPVLVRTIEQFADCHIVLVLPESQIDYWDQLCKQYNVPAHQVVSGGDTRTQSVLNGLQYVPDDAYVAIHDGVRPLVSNTLVDASFAAAKEFGSAVPVVDCVDSIRFQGKAANRADYQLVQTPQTFLSADIKAAYDKVGNSVQTDDATVFEMAGNTVHLIEGLRSNIKITVPVDLKFAEAMLTNEI